MRRLSRSLFSARALVVCGALLAGLAGCGTTFVMEPDPSVPFAKGEVAASFEKDGNNKMTVKVEHLGDAGKLNPAATTYVVWVKPRPTSSATAGDVKPQNVGALRVDGSYTGSLDFPTAFTEFDITITPEPSKDVTTPSGREILHATISGATKS